VRPLQTASPQEALRWKVLAVAGGVGVFILVLVWWMGPALFGASAAPEGTTADAKVTLPAPCAKGEAKETVQFELNGQTRNGTIDGCGHEQNEHVAVVAPTDAPASGLLDVTLADVSTGHNDLRRPIGLFLLAMSCLSGGTYMFLMMTKGPVTKGPPRRRPALA
jgi:hypothetical protein